MPYDLEPEQIDLLREIAEAARHLPREKREFLLLQGGLGSRFDEVIWDGGSVRALARDVEDIISTGLLQRRSGTVRDGLMFTVRPQAYGFLADVDAKAPLVRVEEEIVARYIDGERFQAFYPTAYQRWSEAAALLWGPDSESELTTIGHKTREAVQAFATTLIERDQVRKASSDPAHTANRLRAVIHAHRGRLGEARSQVLDALIVYWGEVIDLLQRQEHGGQKEGEPLAWEDGRRAVFQTAVVMYEIDRTL